MGVVFPESVVHFSLKVVVSKSCLYFLQPLASPSPCRASSLTRAPDDALWCYQQVMLCEDPVLHNQKLFQMKVDWELFESLLVLAEFIIIDMMMSLSLTHSLHTLTMMYHYYSQQQNHQKCFDHNLCILVSEFSS